ncbi:hypothetical protein HMPREF9017_01563 [Parascardovia denticolens F0305]|nr:hypothetical protein HMPREF9017_01563 [Parascardovia denticolens F0305]
MGIRRPSIYFNPRSPCGERPPTPTRRRGQRNFNPRSPCGERPHAVLVDAEVVGISIHAPLAGSDQRIAVRRGVASQISIHAPLAGSDTPDNRFISLAWIFQSTLPLRGATDRLELTCDQWAFQSTLPLRGATNVDAKTRLLVKFQSTLPLRGATSKATTASTTRDISIHAPLAGSDAED